ncbi:CLAVATA3/ESR (CLE)-related protein 5-like [Populus alba x Populus x berolinensis]|nr:CLAVATA3/ESR (CLE)-related protein 5-like [Populus alba x Populus x berolinensis]
MASRVASTSRAMILLLMVLFSAIFLTSEARILKGGHALQGNANNSLLLELGFDRSKLEHYRRLSTLGVPPDRVTPAGPDPHHH